MRTERLSGPHVNALCLSDLKKNLRRNDYLLGFEISFSPFKLRGQVFTIQSLGKDGMECAEKFLTNL